MEILFMIATMMSIAVLNADSGNHFPPPLKKSEELELFKKLREQGNEDARKKLIEHNLRLVAHIVRKYYSNTDEDLQEDLISIGSIGLIKAVDSFKSESGTKFATYGAKCIQNEILMYFRAKKKTQNDVSIFETIDTDKDGNPLTYMDIIRVEDTIADDLHIKFRAKAAIDFINKKLDGREKEIIILRYGIGGIKSLTQREIAERLNISRSYVSRLEKSALKKMSEYLDKF